MKNEEKLNKLRNLFKRSEEISNEWRELSGMFQEDLKIKLSDVKNLADKIEDEFQILIMSSIADCNKNFISLYKESYWELGVSKNLGIKFKYDRRGDFKVFIPGLVILQNGFTFNKVPYYCHYCPIENKIVSFDPLLNVSKVNKEKVMKWLDYARQYMKVRNKYKFFKDRSCEVELKDVKLDENEFIDIKFSSYCDEPTFNCEERNSFGSFKFSNACEEALSVLDETLKNQYYSLPIRIVNNWNKILEIVNEERKEEELCLQELIEIKDMISKENTAFKVLQKLRK